MEHDHELFAEVNNGLKNPHAPGKVFYLDSYHAEYVPSMIMQKTVRSILEPVGIEIKVKYLNAKRIKDEVALKKRALDFEQRTEEQS